MEKNIQSHQFVLASKSPRRKFLLNQAGLIFIVDPSEIDEDDASGTDPEHFVKSLAEAKAWDVSRRHVDRWIVGADTIVYIDETILGKPRSETEAREMLSMLSGRIHHVLTGFCVLNTHEKRKTVQAVITDVLFKSLTQEEIDWYVDTTEPYDKAGSYAIQGLGGAFIKKINGSYTNVVGLPVCELLETMLEEKIITASDRQPYSDMMEPCRKPFQEAS